MPISAKAAMFERTRIGLDAMDRIRDPSGCSTAHSDVVPLVSGEIGEAHSPRLDSPLGKRAAYLDISPGRP